MKMLKKILKLKDEFVKGSIVLFIMINVFNFLNYIFHFSMARMLGAVEYGVFAVLMSVGYIFGVSSEAVSNVASKYTSRFNLKKEHGKIKNFFRKSLRRGLKISCVIFAVYLVFAFLLSVFLNISFWLWMLVGLLIFSDLLFAPIVRGILQGTKQFVKLGTSMIIESSVKLCLGIVLVYFGFRVYGAIGAVILGVFVSIILSLFFLKDVMKGKEEKAEPGKIYSYSLPFFISIVSITLMFSLDIIIARRVFAPEIVGKYAVASMLGKMIFFGTAPISKVLFPISSEKFEGKKNTRVLLYKALSVLFLLCFIAITAFALFPKFIISLLFGADYVGVSGILVFMGISFSILAFTNLLVIYALSKDKSSFSFYLPIFNLIAISLLFIFNSSILQYSLTFLFSNLLMLIGAFLLIKNEKPQIYKQNEKI